MLRTLNIKRQHDKKQTIQIELKNEDIIKVVEELEEVKQFETQRAYHVEALTTQYYNNVNRDFEKIKKFKQDKEFTLKNIEEDSQNILRNIHTNIKQFRDLKDDI